MTEREQRLTIGYEVSENQSKLFALIGFDIPAGTEISFNERHKEILQRKVNGLTATEISEDLGITTSTIATYTNQIKMNVGGFAIGSDVMKASISLGVGLGLIVAPKIPSSGVNLSRGEAEVLAFMVRGYNNNELTYALGKTGPIISQKQQGIYEKLGIKKR